MKTFDEIYEELQRGENNELNRMWEAAKKQNEKSNKIALSSCLIVDILLLIIFREKIINNFSIMILPIIAVYGIVINFGLYMIIYILSSANKKSLQYKGKYKEIVIKKLMNNCYDNL